MSSSHRTAWAAAGTAAALAYASIKALWGLGADIGVRDVAAMREAFGSWEVVATWGTVLPALVAVAVLWLRAGRRGPQRWVRALCWAGAAVLAVPATVGLGEALAVVGGLWSDAPGSPLAPGVFLYVYGSFAVLAVAFLALARDDGRGAHPAR